MQHIPATIEEQLVLKAVREECPWEGLPKRLQSTLATKDEWHRRIIEHCIRKRLQWNSCFARKVIKESEYYEEMMRYLRKNLALFPYHLAEYVCRVMRISPFRYYCDMIFEVMKNEQPYDSLPNFTAADALRLTGVGRNEFIDIMNKCRSKKFMWKINKSIAKELLPTQPVDFNIEPWWAVCLVNFTLEEFKKLSDEEMATIDKVCKEELNSFIHFDPEIIKGLYRRGLVYFDVPVYTDDRFKVSRLEGFVSNREQMYEDPIEELLYAVFVVASENSTVAELAATLQADLLQLQAAASFACRLGWANKLIDPASVLQESSTHGSIGVTLSDEEDCSVASMGSANLSTDGSHLELSGMEHSRSASSQARVAFIVDANITSYLMMGSVSPGLKSHAVTLYEAGKLGHASIADLCKDLRTLEGAKFEGELQEFANHACSLRCVLECLLSGGVSDNNKEVEGLDKLDASVIQTHEANSRSNLSGKSGNLGTNERDHNGDEELSGDLNASESDVLILPGSNLSEKSGNLDTNERDHCGDEELPGDLNTDQDASESNVPILPASPQDDPAHSEGADRHGSDEEPSAISSSNTHNQVEESTLASSLQNDGDGRNRRNYRVDMLRCESLASLAPATLERLFNRDYDIVLSMIPLPQSSILPGPTGPIHFGPPSHSSMTPWMKLVLYAAVSNGPLSVILMKGQCLRLVPAPLAGCEKALIWSWDDSTTGGLGGKFEGNLVKGSVLLHCLNSLLKHSAVLVQPLNKDDLDRSGKIMTLDIPLPLKNSDGSVVEVGPEYGLGMVASSKLNFLLRDLAHKLDLWTIGYVRLIRLLIENDTDQFLPDDEKYEWVPLSVEFGVPLFSPKLCNDICKRVISSQLLQTESFNEHHEAMHNLRRQLREFCSDYHATGPTAKLLYNKEKLNSSRQLMTYASGRWNPLVDPSSPLSGAKGDYQRKKLAMRQRSRWEVLSFDGSILRSYALNPVYEPATRPIDESMPLVTPKVDSEEAESKEVVLPGVNLLFDGSELSAFEIGACLQARQPVCLIAEASSASTAFGVV